jgi:hypothetical protein
MTTIKITYTTYVDAESNNLPLPDDGNTYFSVEDTTPLAANGNGFNKITGELKNARDSFSEWSTSSKMFQGILVGNGVDSSVSLNNPYASAANIYVCAMSQTPAAIQLNLETTDTCGDISTVYQYKEGEEEQPTNFTPESIPQDIGSGWKVEADSASYGAVLFYTGSPEYLTLPKITIEISAGAFTSIGLRQNPLIGIQLVQWLYASTPACAPPPRPFPSPYPSPFPSPSPIPGPEPAPNVPFGLNGLKTLGYIVASLAWEVDNGLSGLKIVFDTPNLSPIYVSHQKLQPVSNFPVNEVAGFVRLKCEMKMVAVPIDEFYPFKTDFFFAPINGLAHVPLYYMAEGNGPKQEAGYLTLTYKVTPGLALSRVMLVKYSSANLIPPASAPGPAVAAARRHRALY